MRVVKIILLFMLVISQMSYGQPTYIGPYYTDEMELGTIADANWVDGYFSWSTTTILAEAIDALNEISDDFNTHVSSDGTDHTYINQDLRTFADVVFNRITCTELYGSSEDEDFVYYDTIGDLWRWYIAGATKLELNSSGDLTATGNLAADGAIFNGTVDASALPIDPNHLTNKRYVDLALGTRDTFFLSDTVSAVDANNLMYQHETTEAESTIVSGAMGLGDDQHIQRWITEAGQPNTELINAGVVAFDVHAKKGAANQRATQLYCVLSYVDAAGVMGETAIASSAITEELTEVEDIIHIHASLAESVVIDITDRIILDIYANVGTGVQDSVVTIYMEGVHDSHVDFEVSGGIWQNWGKILDDWNAVGQVTGDSYVGVGTGAGVFAWETGATLRTSLGLGTGDALTVATVNTGQGDYELYAMNQDVETTDTPTFAGETITGDLFLSNAEQTEGYKWTAGTYPDSLALDCVEAGANSTLGLYSNDGDGSDSVVHRIYGVGIPTDVTNAEYLEIGYRNEAGGRFFITTGEAGSGSLKDIELEAPNIRFDSATKTFVESDLNVDGIAEATDFKGTIGATTPAAGTFTDVDLETVGTHEYKIGGNRALAMPVGITNIAVGTGAGNDLATGAAQNTLIGAYAGTDITTAKRNTAIGYYALSRATTTSTNDKNTVMGYAAGQDINGGMENVAIGQLSLAENITGDYNTCVGSMAGIGASNKSFSANTLIGRSAGHCLETGAGNIFLGYGVGGTTTTGAYNIGIGYNLYTTEVDTSYELNIGGLITGRLDAPKSVTVDGALTAAAVTATEIYLNDPCTSITEDGSGNLTFTDKVYGSKTLSEMGSPTMVDVSDPCSGTWAEAGNKNLTGLGSSKILIKWIKITTSSTDWTLTLYSDDGHSNDAWEIVSNRSGDYNAYLDIPYEDKDGDSELHFVWVDNSGANTFSFEILGFRLL